MGEQGGEQGQGQAASNPHLDDQSAVTAAAVLGDLVDLGHGVEGGEQERES